MTGTRKHISPTAKLARIRGFKPVPWFWYLLIIAISILGSENISSQIWTEDFESDAVGATQGLGTPPRWTSTPPASMNNDSAWAVESRYGNKQFLGRNLSDVGIWETKFVDISSYSSVYISVALRDSGVLDNFQDTIQLYYQINNGSQVLWHKESGNFSTSFITVSTGNLSGDSIKVIVRIRNGDTDETHIIDDIEIHAHQTLYSISNGNWDTQGTWSDSRGGSSCDCWPSGLDNAIIESPDIVEIASDDSITNLTIESGGTLRWLSGNHDFYIKNGGTIQIDNGGTLTRNNQSGANLVIEDEWQDVTIIANNSIDVSRIELENYQGSLTLTGSSSVTLDGGLVITGDGDAFDAAHTNWDPDITVTNNLSGILTIGGNLGINGAASGNLIFTNNGTIDLNGNISNVDANSSFFNTTNSDSKKLAVFHCNLIPSSLARFSTSSFPLGTFPLA